MNRRRKLYLAQQVLRALPERERRRYTAVLRQYQRGETQGIDAVLDMILTAGAADRKRRSDKRTDAARRVLVGARLPRSEAEDCRRAAALEGMSLYLWVRVALMAAAAVSCGRAAAGGGSVAPGGAAPGSGGACPA